MIPEAVTLDVTFGWRCDGGANALCSFDLLPELLGHGETEDEALEDLRAQFAALVWH